MITITFTTEKTDSNLIWWDICSDNNAKDNDPILYDAITYQIFDAVTRTGQDKKNRDVLPRDEVIGLCIRFLWSYKSDNLRIIFDDQGLVPFSAILDPKGYNRKWLESKFN